MGSATLFGLVALLVVGLGVFCLVERIKRQKAQSSIIRSGNADDYMGFIFGASSAPSQGKAGSTKPMESASLLSGQEEYEAII